MYNQNYEDYIRSILGYNNETYRENPYNEPYNTNITYQNDYNMYRQNNELEQYYPEIYKIIYPMVRKVCNNRENIDRETLENMVDEIYSAVEVVEESNQENRNETKGVNKNSAIYTSKADIDKTTKENIENRESRNLGIRDLIKILIIRELLRNNHRPPMPPPRPPFPGNGRPPIRPRIYEDYI